MKVEIRTEAVPFPEKEYINGIFAAVCMLHRNCSQCVIQYLILL